MVPAAHRSGVGRRRARPGFRVVARLAASVPLPVLGCAALPGMALGRPLALGSLRFRPAQPAGGAGDERHRRRPGGPGAPPTFRANVLRGEDAWLIPPNSTS